MQYELKDFCATANSLGRQQTGKGAVHAMCREAERKRIERTNPNPKMPLVRFVGDTWRTGGVLALSRAFGDAYLKVICAVWVLVPT